MLKIRVIPTLLFRDVGLIKGVGFDSWRRVGAPMQAVKVFNTRDVDELILLDIEATLEARAPDYELLVALAEECFVPLTVGGGVSSIEDIRQLLLTGADKVSINTAAYANPGLISEAAALFGSQCVVAAIDFRCHEDNRYECYSHCGRVNTGLDPVAWAQEVEWRGAGEILLTSIERDGAMQGYDLQLTSKVTQAVSIPVIASGGAGSYDHMLQAVRDGGASAVSAASLYLFTQCTPLEAKSYLARNGIPIRQSYGRRVGNMGM